MNIPDNCDPNDTQSFFAADFCSRAIVELLNLNFGLMGNAFDEKFSDNS